jgi:hypothetical protein
MIKTAASTGIVPKALVAFEQYFPEAQGIIDDGLPPTDRRLARTPRSTWSTQEGVIPNIK